MHLGKLTLAELWGRGRIGETEDEKRMCCEQSPIKSSQWEPKLAWPSLLTLRGTGVGVCWGVFGYVWGYLGVFGCLGGCWGLFGCVGGVGVGALLLC